MSKHLSTDSYTDIQNKPLESKMTIVVVGNCKKLNIRKKPSLSGEIIDVLNSGDILEKTGTYVSDGFSEVRLLSGIYGYAMTKYLMESS